MQRCQNYGSNVFYGFLFIFVTHSIFLCVLLNVFRAHKGATFGIKYIKKIKLSFLDSFIIRLLDGAVVRVPVLPIFHNK